MEIRAITWNLFHGRDFPPDPALHTWRSRLLGERPSETPPTSRSTGSSCDEFAAVLGARAVGRRPAAGVPAALGRGAGRRLRRRGPALAHLPQLARPRARRRSRAGTPTCSAPGRVARTSPWSEARITGASSTAESSCCAAAPSDGRWPSPGSARGSAWRTSTPARAPPARRGGRAPRCRGGRRLGRRFAADLRRRLQPAARARRELFDELAERFGLGAPTGPDAIDHLLARGLEIVERPRAWPPEAREVPCEGLATAPLGPRPGRSEIRHPKRLTARVARA